MIKKLAALILAVFCLTAATCAGSVSCSKGADGKWECSVSAHKHE